VVVRGRLFGVCCCDRIECAVFFVVVALWYLVLQFEELVVFGYLYKDIVYVEFVELVCD